jgi:hypothetical protein
LHQFCCFNLCTKLVDLKLKNVDFTLAGFRLKRVDFMLGDFKLGVENVGTEYLSFLLEVRV